MAKKNELTYAKALDELNALVKDLENDQINVDELSEKVKRAAVLLNFCQVRLRSTEEEVRNIMDNMQGKEE
ncbi:MAG: exodeoxyribonuclease VII small subunit [Ferruginibacter sp.]|nr:exodeoxyribonuclease VII small subunit [Ferruginibacter sp.]